MKEMEFRAWDFGKKNDDSYKERMSMPFFIYDDWVNFDGDVIMMSMLRDIDTNNDNKRRFHIMQWTGLYDRNGLKIFEGDVVRWGMDGVELSGIRYAEVKPLPSIELNLLFYENDTTGERKPPIEPYSFKFPNFIYSNTEKYLEVVGNIYKNKEFLSC